MQDAGVGCASPRGCVPAPGAFHFISSAGWRPRFLAHPVPSLGSGVESLHRPSLCWTRRCHALRASRSSPSIIRRLFLSTTCGKMLLGGFWGGDSKSTLFALRSQKLSPASRERLQEMDEELGMEYTCSSSGSQSSRNPGTIGSAALRAACPGSRYPEESLASGRLPWLAFVAAAEAHT